MRHIRPYELFNQLKEPAAERIAQVKIPNRCDLFLLETFALITAIRIVNAKRIFEFGTFFGSTTLNLALNSPPDAEIFTLDLSAREAGEITQHSADIPITAAHFEKGQMEFEKSPLAHKITQLTGNSRHFDFSNWRDSIDFIFIDGGHDLDTVSTDTHNALEMIRKTSPAAIFWHDYGNPTYPEITEFLESLATQRELFHVQDTMLCGWFSH